MRRAKACFRFSRRSAWWRSAPSVFWATGRRASGCTARGAGDRSGLIRVAAYLGALVFYAGTLEVLGFIVATAIAITFILRFAERYSWRATLGLTLGTIVGCQVLFVLWLGAMLPTGTLWANLLE